VPDADDTAGALIALAHLDRGNPEVWESAALGVRWLLNLQNRDGGIPTFCRGWGTLPFDRSSTDLTAHAVRAWIEWQPLLDPPLAQRVSRAIVRALRFLSTHQRADGAFVPLWFGNQMEDREENPLVGTGRVLAALATMPARPDLPVDAIRDRAVCWLLAAQNADGGWGGGPSVPSSIEETAIAITGLAAAGRGGDRTALAAAVRRGVAWLIGATDGGSRFPTAPVGLYFARLWYAEELYPLIFVTGALEAAAAAERRGMRHAFA
jgi:squalene-hopene/tetraprenyl-beta-curcumene cyclase